MLKNGNNANNAGTSHYTAVGGNQRVLPMRTLAPSTSAKCIGVDLVAVNASATPCKCPCRQLPLIAAVASVYWPVPVFFSITLTEREPLSANHVTVGWTDGCQLRSSVIESARGSY